MPVDTDLDIVILIGLSFLYAILYFEADSLHPSHM